MAPTKQGMDFFRYSLGLLKDRKLRQAKLRYGPAAAVVYLALLELIYQDKGYYIRYDDDLIWDLTEYLQGADCPDAGTIRGIVEALVAGGLFDGELFKRKILTAKRLQKEFYNTTSSRKAVEVDFSIWLLSREEMEVISSKSVILKQLDERADKGDNRAISGENRPDCRQSRVEESREEQSREEESRVEQDRREGCAPCTGETPPPSIGEEKPDLEAVRALYNRLCGMLPPCGALNPARKRALRQRFAQGYTRADFERLFEKAAASGFLRGDNSRHWQAAFDWLIQEENMAKVLEGNYDRPSPPGPALCARSYDLAAFEEGGFCLPT